MLDQPRETLSLLQAAICQICNALRVTSRVRHPEGRITELPPECQLRIRVLRQAGYLGKLRSTRGIVCRRRDPAVSTKSFAFRCRGACQRVTYHHSKTPPQHCPNCPGLGGGYFQAEPQLDQREDVQCILLQEQPHDAGPGSQPRRLNCVLRGRACGSFVSGDVIHAAGVLSVEPGHTPPADGWGAANTYPAQFEVHHAYALNSRFPKERGAEEAEAAEKRMLRFMRQHGAADLGESIRSRLVQHFAPAIHGEWLAKAAILASLFGGVTYAATAGSRQRGDINVLLLGDPGTAKSELLRAISAGHPRAVRTCGKGATQAGLGAAAVEDPEDGQWRVEAGAVVHANEGLLLVDEVDKLPEDGQDILHEPLEQGTMSIHKAGLNVVLPAACSCIAVGNSRAGQPRYDKSKSLEANTDLKPSFLSRFDLRIAIPDTPDAAADERRAAYVVDGHCAAHRDFGGSFPGEAEYEWRGRDEPLTGEFLKDFIHLARATVRPRIPLRLSNELARFYQEARALAGKKTLPVSIDARHCAALARITQAAARMRLADEATLGDAEYAIGLFTRALRASCPNRPNAAGYPELVKFFATHCHKAHAAEELLDLLEEELRRAEQQLWREEAKLRRTKQRSSADTPGEAYLGIEDFVAVARRGGRGIPEEKVFAFVRSSAFEARFVVSRENLYVGEVIKRRPAAAILTELLDAHGWKRAETGCWLGESKALSCRAFFSEARKAGVSYGKCEKYIASDAFAHGRYELREGLEASVEERFLEALPTAFPKNAAAQGVRLSEEDVWAGMQKALDTSGGLKPKDFRNCLRHSWRFHLGYKLHGEEGTITPLARSGAEQALLDENLEKELRVTRITLRGDYREE